MWRDGGGRGDSFAHFFAWFQVTEELSPGAGAAASAAGNGREYGVAMRSLLAPSAKDECK